MEVYYQALHNDPSFQAAHGTYLANSEAVPQAKANLLPNLSASNSLSRYANQGDVNQVITSGDQSVNQNSFSITATQPVFNYASWMTFKQAKDSVKSAEASYNAAAQDLIVRVGQAYLGVLQAKDTLRYTQAQKRALERQMNQAQQRYKVGLSTMTEVYQAQAQYDAMAAQEISDKNTLYIQFQTLTTLTNKSYSSIAPLKKGTVPLIRPIPDNPGTWVEKSKTQNYSLLSAKYAMEVARKNIKIQQGGHYPTLSLEGEYDNLSNDATASSDPTGQNTAISLNLSIPIYQGGLINSLTRQAQYEFETAAANFQNTYLNTLVSTKNAYNTLIVSINQIKADDRAIMSAQNSVTSTDSQFQAGIATMVDVLNTQQQLYQAQTNKATDQYAYINAILSLKQAAGTLSLHDLQELNTWLDNNPKHAIYDNEEIE